MEILQIVVLILGAILFTVSFFIPDKQVNTKEIRDKEERIFMELMEKEVPNIRKKIDEATEESIERAKENTQRQMERLTNEKMMAINEYSDTVISEIHKNHEEAVFLYDMLNNKHAQVKNTAAELNQVMKQSKQTQVAVKNAKPKEEKKEVNASASEKALAAGQVVEKQVAVKEAGLKTANSKKLNENRLSSKGTQANEKTEVAFEPMKTKELEVIVPPEDFPKVETKKKKETEISNPNKVDIVFATEGKEDNHNERILEMHREGKSNMAIAKELGLGIGEVKLVIDLFKGGM